MHRLRRLAASHLRADFSCDPVIDQFSFLSIETDPYVSRLDVAMYEGLMPVICLPQAMQIIQPLGDRSQQFGHGTNRQ